ncbi:Protein of unknown function, partial [Gryllus bimaculatus]
ACAGGAVCCSGGGGGVLHLLGAAPRAAPAGRVRQRQPGPAQPRGGAALPGAHLHLGHPLLPLHRHQPRALPHHVAQVPGSFQVDAGAAVRSVAQSLGQAAHVQRASAAAARGGRGRRRAAG